MAAGYIDRAVLGDIANATRAQNGTGRKYLPSELAAGVAALDGTRGSTPIEYDVGTGRGIVSERVLSAVADAIRAQNGEATRHAPGEMAPAILALT